MPATNPGPSTLTKREALFVTSEWTGAAISGCEPTGKLGPHLSQSGVCNRHFPRAPIDRRHQSSWSGSSRACLVPGQLPT